VASKSEIEAKIESLASQGLEPPVRQIHMEFGYRGSLSSIVTVLSAWRSERNRTQGRA
jgi:hypothetical protein